MRRAQLRARRHGSCGPTSRSWLGVADTYVCAYPNAGLPNAFGEYDESAERDRGDPARIRRAGAGQYRRRLLRHHAGAHPPDARGGRAGSRAARAAAAAPSSCRLSGLEPLNIDDRQPVRQRRRAHQRHRLGEVPQADRGRRLRRRARCRAPAGRRAARRSSTSTWTRACSIRKRRWCASCIWSPPSRTSPACRS